MLPDERDYADPEPCALSWFDGYHGFLFDLLGGCVVAWLILLALLAGLGAF